MTDIYGYSVSSTGYSVLDSNPTVPFFQPPSYNNGIIRFAWSASPDNDFLKYYLYSSTADDMSGKTILSTSTIRNDTTHSMVLNITDPLKYYQVIVEDQWGFFSESSIVQPNMPFTMIKNYGGIQNERGYSIWQTNDGGYVYSTFDKVDSSEFNPNKVQTKTKNAKKIFQLEPHIHQMILDATNADFANPASEEVDNIKVGIAEESIWDSKRFKIRLTSTKTGRKLDLNTGFNIRIKDLTTEEEDEVPVIDDDTVPTDPITDDGGGTVDEDTTDEDTYEKPVDDDDDDDKPDKPDKPDEPEEPDEPKPGEHDGPPPDYDGGGTDPSEYGAQIPSWMLYESQVHFIVYGGVDSDGVRQPNVFRQIYILMNEMGFGSIPATDPEEVRLRTLFKALGAWIWRNRETPKDRLDNRMFYEHLAMLLAVYAPSGGEDDWVSRFYEAEDVTIHPEILNYADETILGVGRDVGDGRGKALESAILAFILQGAEDAASGS